MFPIHRLPNKPHLKTGSQRVLPSGSALQKLVKTNSESGDANVDKIGAKLGLKSVDKQNLISKNIKTGDRTSILEISGAIDTSISVLKSSPPQTSHSSVTIMQLTDKIQLFRQSCTQYADECSPQQRFRFRELLTKFDTYCDQLKTTNTLATNKLLTDIQNTLRDIVNLVQR